MNTKERKEEKEVGNGKSEGGDVQIRDYVDDTEDYNKHLLECVSFAKVRDIVAYAGFPVFACAVQILPAERAVPVPCYVDLVVAVVVIFKILTVGVVQRCFKEIGKSSRIDDKVVQDQRQRDDYDLQDERQDQPKEEEVEPRRSKRARTEKSFRPDFVSFMVENEPTSYQEAITSLE
ncbi:hypothetical protein Tco_1006307 [Tanacetum coccineum]|uniref:Uncharacterized protein n=1 Tax=Tanacetum coccineum TaxID=301880 RepID=A0ABQ5FHX4_9ASTR